MKQLLLALLLLSGCAAQQNSAAEVIQEPYQDGFTLPTGKQVSFSEITWCHGIICQRGGDCARNEVYASCEMRLFLTEEFMTVLTEKLCLHTGPNPYYVIARADGSDRFLGLLYQQSGQWMVVRFPGEHRLPVSAQELHIRGKAVLYLSFSFGNSISFSLDDRLFREEGRIPSHANDRMRDL